MHEEPTIDQLWDAIGEESRMFTQNPILQGYLRAAGYPTHTLSAQDWDEYESVFHGALVGYEWLHWHDAHMTHGGA
jgi:hypothetical protein